MSTHPNRYTRRVVHTIALACKEAERLDHAVVGPEHVLLALLREEHGAASDVLRELRVSLSHFYRLLCASAPSGGARTNGKRELTPEARHAVELARDEARRLGHVYVGTEHVLLGVLHEFQQHGQNSTTWALERAGITLDAARAQVQQLRASGRQFDNSLPDRETVRSFRAQVAPRRGFPYQQREAPPSVPKMFSPQARAVLVAAHAGARSAHQEAIGPQHIMLALLEQRDGIPARVLTGLGGDLARLSAALLGHAGHRSQLAPDTLELTSHARFLVERALDEARRLGHNHVMPAHLLLALTHERDGVVMTVLSRAGLDPRHVYARTHAALREAPSTARNG